MNPAALAAAGAEARLRKRDCRAAGMLEPLRNPVNWDNLRKVAVLV